MSWKSTKELKRINDIDTRLVQVELNGGGSSGGTWLGYDTLFDELTPYTGYRGDSDPNTPTSASLFRLSYISIDSTTGIPTELFANGDARFIHIWDNRANYTYQ